MTITGDYLFFGLMLLALVLMFQANRGILIGTGAFLIWFAMGFWMFFSTSPPLDISEIWVQILVYVFFAILPFGTLLQMMNTEIRHEAGGRGEGRGTAWRTWGAKPTVKTLSRTEQYRKDLRRRLR